MKIVVLTYLMAAVLSSAAELGFAMMENGDRVELTRHSTGCFHNSTSYYEVRKVNDSFEFCQYAITWDEGKPRKVVEKKAIGKIALSAEDVRGLDKLLKYYRGEKDSFSTTQVSLLVEYFEPDRRVKVERLKDGSGGFGLEERKDIVTLYSLARRFEKLDLKDTGKNQEVVPPEPDTKAPAE